MARLVCALLRLTLKSASRAPSAASVTPLSSACVSAATSSGQAPRLPAAATVLRARSASDPADWEVPD